MAKTCFLSCLLVCLSCTCLKLSAFSLPIRSSFCGMLAVYYFGGLFAFVFYSSYFSLLSKKSRNSFAGQRACDVILFFAALALGANTAFPSVRFADPKLQALSATLFVRGTWLAYQSILIFTLALGIFRRPEESESVHS